MAQDAATGRISRSALDAAVELGKAQAKALAALPGAITAIAEAANNINATANEARAVIRKAQAVTDRLDSMLDHVEPAVSEITPTLQALKEAQQRIVAMTGSTEKMASFVEDAGAGLSKLAGISGATGLFSRIAAAAKPAEPTGRTTRPLCSPVRTPSLRATRCCQPETPSRGGHRGAGRSLDGAADRAVEGRARPRRRRPRSSDAAPTPRLAERRSDAARPTLPQRRRRR